MLIGSWDEFIRLLHFQRDYLFELYLPDISPVLGYLISKYVQDVKFGDYSIKEASKIRYGAFTSKYAGQIVVPPVIVTFLKPIPDLVSRYLYNWRLLIVDNDGFYNVKANYALTANILLYDRTGLPLGRIQLLGIFPTTLPSYDISYKKEGIVSFDTEFSIDRIRTFIL